VIFTGTRGNTGHKPRLHFPQSGERKRRRRRSSSQSTRSLWLWEVCVVWNRVCGRCMLTHTHTHKDKEVRLQTWAVEPPHAHTHTHTHTHTTRRVVSGVMSSSESSSVVVVTAAVMTTMRRRRGGSRGDRRTTSGRRRLGFHREERGTFRHRQIFEEEKRKRAREVSQRAGQSLHG